MTLDFITIDLKVILTAFGIIVAISVAFYFQWWRNRKRLSYEILSNVALLSTEEEIQDKVEIRYEGQPVKNVRLIVIKLINDGYVPIKKDDFEKRVRFVFPGAKILTSEKVKFHPDNLGTQMAYRDDWIEMDPALFNRKDYVQFKVLLSAYDGMKIDARIIGVSSIQKVKNFGWTFEIIFLLIGATVVSTFQAFIKLFFESSSSSVKNTIVTIALTGLVVGTLTYWLFHRKRQRE